MAFPDHFLDQLKARLSPAEVISKRTKLTRKGREHLGLCPFHREKTPSFYVYEDHYHCFGCGAHGSVIDFVMNTENMSFPEAVERLAGEAGMTIPAESPEERQRMARRDGLLEVMEAACRTYEERLRAPEGARALAYLRDRGLDETVMARFRLGYAPAGRAFLGGALGKDGVTNERLLEGGLMKQPEDGRPPYDYFRDRVIFPITDRRDRVIAFGGRLLGEGEPKYLNSPETPLFHKSRSLYGQAQAQAAARKQRQLLVTEGYMDVISLHQAGFETAVAPLGTALTEAQMGEMWRLAPEPVLCFDGDTAGQRAGAKAAQRALPLLKPGKSLRFAHLPTGEDPDSLVKGEGPGAMRQVLQTAEPLFETLWRQVVETAPQDTPERRAEIWKTLKDLVYSIADETVRKSYYEAFEARFWRRDQGRRQSDKGRAVRSRSASPNPARRRAQMLLATLLARPDLYDHVGEQLGSLSFEDRILDDLRQAILDVLQDHKPRRSEELVTALKQQDRAQGLEAILGLQEVRFMRRRDGTLSEEAPIDRILEVWNQYFNQIWKQALRKDLSDRLRRLVGEGAEDDWATVQALIQSRLDDQGP